MNWQSAAERVGKAVDLAGVAVIAVGILTVLALSVRRGIHHDDWTEIYSQPPTDRTPGRLRPCTRSAYEKGNRRS